MSLKKDTHVMIGGKDCGKVCVPLLRVVSPPSMTKVGHTMDPWHERFHYVSDDVLVVMEKDKVVNGLPMVKSKEKELRNHVILRHHPAMDFITLKDQSSDSRRVFFLRSLEQVSRGIKLFFSLERMSMKVSFENCITFTSGSSLLLVTMT